MAEEEELYSENRKIFKAGTSYVVALPPWWAKDVKEVKMRVFKDKIVIEKVGDSME